MTARTAALAALFALSTAGLAAEPAQLKSIDPLTLPAPNMLEPMSFAPDPRTPAEKIQPMLWAEALKQGADAVIPIIITLHEPLLAEPLRGATAEADAYRIQWVASLAHQFAPQARAAGMMDIRALSLFPVLFGRTLAANLPRLAAVGNVRAVDLDLPIRGTRVQGASLIKADQLRTLLGGNGTGIGVAVVDSGVDDSYAELSSRVVAQGDYTATTGDGTIDGTGHGTAVAGIIAGTALGMARDATLWALKVLRNDGTGDTSMTLSALNSAYANRDLFGGLDVVNMSLGTPSVAYNNDCDAAQPAMATVVNALVAEGIVIFVASGNDGFINGVEFPSCLSNVIAVGAVYDANIGPAVFSNCTDSSTATDQIACYSDSGVPLDILAPSHCAETTGPMGSCFGGTSAAAPYAAGVAAQILSLLPATTPAQLRTALMTTGQPITDVNSITRSRIDGVEAYQALAGTGGGCVPDSNTACLLGGKFKVEVQWTTASATGAAQVMSFGGQRAESDESVFFWFFGPENFEMGVKMVDACVAPYNHYWAFVSGLTNQAYTVTITRTSNPLDVTTYSNPLNTLPTTVADTSAFTCP